jgi:hypothetical protein
VCDGSDHHPWHGWLRQINPMVAMGMPSPPVTLQQDDCNYLFLLIIFDFALT